MRKPNLSLPLFASLFFLSACQPESGREAVPVESPVVVPAVPGRTSAESAVVPSVVKADEIDPLALAKKSNCLSCHAIDKKLVGPAWKDVAVKYRGDTGAEARLMNKVAQGGAGVWGTMPMPAHPQLKEADRKTLVKFVLNLQ